MVSAVIDLLSAMMAGYFATSKVNPDFFLSAGEESGFGEVLAALLGMINLGFFVWGLNVAARE